MTTLNVLRCPCCGLLVARARLTRGALGHNLQALKKTINNTTNRGGITWTRRPMSREELTLAGKAVAAAAETITSNLDEDELTVVNPESFLAEIDDDSVLNEITADWIKDAENELEYRRQIVADEKYRRRGDR